jgi:hypothetical protein
MNVHEFLGVLNSMDFTTRYWDLCDRFPFKPDSDSLRGTKKDVLIALTEAGATPRYCSADRSYRVDEEQIGDLLWWGLFVKQRSGLELLIVGEGSGQRAGGNFAVLAYEARRHADPTFSRDRFKGPPPYPRPVHGNPEDLRRIATEFVRLLRLIKTALRMHHERGQTPTNE